MSGLPPYDDSGGDLPECTSAAEYRLEDDNTPEQQRWLGLVLVCVPWVCGLIGRWLYAHWPR